MNTRKLSVIVPVYNGAMTLDRCIQSVINQTYKNFELIIVNDGSEDESLQIAKKYAVEDERVRVLSQENKGVSAARNYGLQEAKGKWITFVDADDYLDVNCFDAVLKQEAVKSVELVLWNRMDVYRNRQEEKKIFVDNEWENNLVNDLIGKVFYNQNGNLEICSACCRLFRRDIICHESICFDNSLSMGEDLIFMLDYLKAVRQFCYIDKAMYYRCMTEQSAMHGFNPQIQESVVRLLRTIKKHIDTQQNGNILKAYQIYVLRGPVTTYLECYLCNSLNRDGRRKRSKELKAFLKTEVIAEAINSIDDKKLSNRLKVKLFCIKYRWMMVLDHWYQRKEYM